MCIPYIRYLDFYMLIVYWFQKLGCAAFNRPPSVNLLCIIWFRLIKGTKKIIHCFHFALNNMQVLKNFTQSLFVRANQTILHAVKVRNSKAAILSLVPFSWFIKMGNLLQNLLVYFSRRKIYKWLVSDSKRK